MKKLKLDFQHLGNVEVLTGSQMKQVMGGGIESRDTGRCYQSPVTCVLDDEPGVCEENSLNKCVCRTTVASMVDQKCVKPRVEPE